MSIGQLTLKGKLDSVLQHPSILKDFLAGKSSEEIRDKILELRRMKVEKRAEKEVFEFIKQLKTNSAHEINSTQKLKLNKLCYI
jgi:hypothetical protein